MKEKKSLRPTDIDKETLAHLDDEQLQAIAGGDRRDDLDDEQEESCRYVTCGGATNMQ